MFGLKKKPAPLAEVVEEEVELPGIRHWTFCEGGEPGKLVHFFRPGEENRRHVIVLVLATLKHSRAQLLTVQDEGKMILRSYCHGLLEVGMPQPIRVGKAVQVTLDCSYDDENVASLTVWGYTEDWHPDDENVLP